MKGRNQSWLKCFKNMLRLNELPNEEAANSQQQLLQPGRVLKQKHLSYDCKKCDLHKYNNNIQLQQQHTHIKQHHTHTHTTTTYRKYKQSNRTNLDRKGGELSIINDRAFF
mmetsp:Transcript_34813/g.38508  ORF Transcript_34813/g.38508 Transcript_34813/m.38508 type:complete len:111 (+) Transcript_34813:492-824(+)